MQYSALHYTTLQYNTIQYSTVQYRERHHIKIHTQFNIPNNKNELMTRSCELSPTNASCILSYCATFMYISATDIWLEMVFIPPGEESGS